MATGFRCFIVRTYAVRVHVEYCTQPTKKRRRRTAVPARKFYYCTLTVCVCSDAAASQFRSYLYISRTSNPTHDARTAERCACGVSLSSRTHSRNSVGYSDLTRALTETSVSQNSSDSGELITRAIDKVETNVNNTQNRSALNYARERNVSADGKQLNRRLAVVQKNVRCSLVFTVRTPTCICA